jgi:predicted secreted protein
MAKETQREWRRAVVAALTKEDWDEKFRQRMARKLS